MTAVYVLDDGKGLLSPLTDLRPSFMVRTGALTTLERTQRLLGAGRLAGLAKTVAGVLVPEARAAYTRELVGVPVNPSSMAGEIAVLNGRCTDPQVLGTLRPGEARLETGSGNLVCARCDLLRLKAVLGGDYHGLGVESAPESTLMSRPWHVRRSRDRALSLDLALLAAEPGWRTASLAVAMGDGISVHGSATVSPGVVLDATNGPIVIDERAAIRPGAILIGPCYVGPHSTVLERATIRPNTAVGPRCKVNGEISGVIFQGFANKAHEGFLGDSWVGEWVNLGAGTTNSNLLNTYGEVVSRAGPGTPNERTGEQFLGAIIGDHVKTAICTRIMTGSVINTGTMWAATSPYSGTLPGFTWGTDEGRRQFRLSKFLEVARAAMARRGATPSAAYEALLSELHHSAGAWFKNEPD
jgi:UDP-N-acetylglucosamine diphosphorylase / glucose-1-phosphate thymidylyltransferase / UDP-N-acetylgalactosamine diphosphorylase / glucosamine-1-phosphate N-acetyltransferase / galactosamine-1-phosphate N-acetyltransferase